MSVSGDSAAIGSSVATTLAALASHSSFIFLDEQVSRGLVPRAQAEALKLRFAELHRQAAASVERERDALAAARDLRTQVREEQIALERARIHKEQVEALSEAADSERRKLAHSLNEQESRETGLQIELNELRGVEAELQTDVAKLRRDNEAIVQPALAAIVQEIADTKAEISRAVSAGEGLARTKAGLKDRILVLQAQTGVSESTSGALGLELSKVQGDPNRVERAISAVRGALDEARAEHASLTAGIAARRLELDEQARALSEAATVRAALGEKLGRYRGDIDARGAEVEDVDRSLRSEKAMHKDLLERRVELQSEAAAAEAAVRNAEAERSALQGAYDRARREFKRQDDQHNSLLAAKPSVTSRIEEQRLLLASMVAEGLEEEKRVSALKRDMDLQIASYLREEGLERKHRAAVEEMLVECASLSRDKDRWHAEEVLARKQLSALKAQRDLKSRELASLLHDRKAAVELSKVKELTLVDLTKQLADVNGRLRTFAAMYEVVKNERNTIANSIQTASQAIAEQRERLKILRNEVDILQNESLAKERALARERQEHAAAVAQRKLLLDDSNRAALMYKESQDRVEAQIRAIDKLNTVINGLEKDMLGLKSAYEAAVETRNYAGIQLIDRNDELVILYEKSNLHEATLAEGERALVTVQSETRGLRMAVTELERSLHLARGRFPETPMWAERILELQKALVQSRQVSEKLCADLEAPSTADRWKALGGQDPPAAELKAKVEDLEARVSAVRGQLLEKDLILEELDSLTAKLQGALAAAGPGGPSAAASVAASSASDQQLSGAPLVARQVADVQARLKDVTRHMMATVSELSMYQATAIKLGAETEAAHQVLAQAEAAAARGEPPSMAAQQLHATRERAMLQPPGPRPVDTSFMDPARSAAEPRPNAYIPEGVGIPRPYGEFAPFKPQDAGAGMRHFRPPEHRDIEL